MDVNKSIQDDFLDQAGRALAEQIDREILEDIGWQIIMETNPDWHLVELKWEKGKDTSYFWNEACAWAVENFGLPGDKYMTHPKEDYMLFLFKNSEDAMMFTLKWL
jgi:hypothetical protein